MNELRCNTGNAIGFSVCGPPVDHDVLAFDIAEIAQACRNASARAEFAERELTNRKPILGIFSGCCASAREIETRRIAVSSQKSFGFMAAPSLRQWICHSPNPKKTEVLG